MGTSKHVPLLYDESELELSFCYAFQQDMRFSYTSSPNDAMTLYLHRHSATGLALLLTQLNWKYFFVNQLINFKKLGHSPNFVDLLCTQGEAKKYFYPQWVRECRGGGRRGRRREKYSVIKDLFRNKTEINPRIQKKKKNVAFLAIRYRNFIIVIVSRKKRKKHF